MLEAVDSHPPDEAPALPNLVILLAMGLQSEGGKKTDERLFSDLADIDDWNRSGVGAFVLEDERSFPIKEASGPSEFLPNPGIS
jgi:hypothetical protein